MNPVRRDEERCEGVRGQIRPLRAAPASQVRKNSTAFEDIRQAKDGARAVVGAAGGNAELWLVSEGGLVCQTAAPETYRAYEIGGLRTSRARRTIGSDNVRSLRR